MLVFFFAAVKVPLPNSLLYSVIRTVICIFGSNYINVNLKFFDSLVIKYLIDYQPKSKQALNTDKSL